MKKVKVHTNESLIRDAVKNHYLPALAFMHKVKSMFRRPTLFNYTCRSAAETTGVSFKSVHRYVCTLQKYNLGTIRHGHFQIVGKAKVQQAYSDHKIITVFIDPEWSISMICDALRLVLLRENSYNQIQADHVKNQTRNKESVRSKEIPQGRTHWIPEFLQYKSFIGLRKIGEIVGLSKTGALRFINRAHKAGLVTYKDVIITLGVNTPGNTVKKLQGGHLGYVYVSSKGALKSHWGRTYAFPCNPIKKIDFFFES